MKVGLVYDDSLDRFGGVQTYLRCVVTSLLELGHDVDLITGESSMREFARAEVHSLATNARVRFNGNVASVPILPKSAQIRRLIESRAYEVVHVQAPYSPVLAGAVIRALPTRTALVGTFHVASDRLAPRFGSRGLAAFSRPTLNRFDRWLAVSGEAERFARQNFGLNGMTIVPNMFDFEASASAVPRRFGPGPAIGFLGALVPRKGTLELLRAFELVRGRFSDAQLLIAGSGPLEKRLMTETEKLGLNDSVRFLGSISESEKCRFLAGLDIACLPATYGESFGIVVAEAMAAPGPAVIAGDNPGYTSLLGGFGSTLCAVETRPLASRIVRLLENDGERSSLKEQQVQFSRQFDRRVVTPAIVEAYESAVQSKSPARQVRPEPQTVLCPRESYEVLPWLGKLSASPRRRLVAPMRRFFAGTTDAFSH